MAGSMRDWIEKWDGLGVVVHYDAPSEAWFYVALHDDTLGPPTGGCRMKLYAHPDDGLVDALRLARGMTYKWAGIDLPFGGGKSVIALSRPLRGEERVETLLRFGGLLQSLRGAYWTGEDLGTTPEDMATIARATRYVHGVKKPGEPAVDPGPYTARGVLAGIRGAAEHFLGKENLAGVSVLIQGVGHVGEPLARSLAESGARLILSDLDSERARGLAAELGAEVVGAEAIDTPCDVFAPCAVGGVLNAETIPRLQCRIVAGSANNQLREDGDANRLRDRGILYVPDYVVNAGGAIGLALLGRKRSDAEIEERIDGIREAILAILEESAERGEAPVKAADRRAERNLERKAAALAE